MMDEKIRFGKTNVAKSEVKSRKIKVATFWRWFSVKATRGVNCSKLYAH
jgi:hypothetical protein